MASVVISMGDPGGIGPEVTLKALSARHPVPDHSFTLIGDRTLYHQLNERLHTGLRFVNSFPSSPGETGIIDPFDHPLRSVLEQGGRESAVASMITLEKGARLCLDGKADALVTAPVNKESIIKAGYDFVGQTEYLSALAGTKETAMMLLGPDRNQQWLRVVLVTNHLPIARVSAELSAEKIRLAIRLGIDSCAKLRLPRFKIGVCGLNPHAGEGGEIGREDIELILPVVKDFQREGFDVSGPHAGDSLFYFAYRGDYDVVVCMYHDQGLIPLKMVAFENGINWTLGLPFVRTSPDHGTAYNIVGKGIADSNSMTAAINLALQVQS